MSQLASYYYTSSLLNKEWNGGLSIKYYLGLYLIKDAPSALNISIFFKVIRHQYPKDIIMVILKLLYRIIEAGIY